MKRLALVLAFLPSVALAEQTYNTEKTATHDCSKEPEVTVNTTGSAFTFTGTCDSIQVNGTGNSIKAENVKQIAVNGTGNRAELVAADKISVNGSGNVVTYKKAIGSAKPKISSVGTGNKISKAK